MTRRLLLIATEWFDEEPGGGIRTYSRLLGDAMGQSDWAVDILAFTGRERPSASPGLSIFTCVSGERFKVRAQRLASRLAVLSRHRSYDLIEVPDFRGYGAFISGAVPIPMITRLHLSLSVQISRDSRSPSCAERAAMQLEVVQIKSSRGISAPSSWAAETAAETFRLDSHPDVVPNPGWRSSNEKLRRRASRQVGPLRVAVVGSMQERKGIRIAWEGLKLARVALDLEARFVGSSLDDEGRAVAEEISNGANGPSDWARAVGPVDWCSALEVLRSSDVLVLASPYEVFGYSALEALDAGIPIIVREGTGSASSFKGDACFLFDGTAVGLAEALAVVYESVRSSDNLTLAAQATAARFSSSVVGAQMAAFYERVLEG